MFHMEHYILFYLNILNCSMWNNILGYYYFIYTTIEIMLWRQTLRRTLKNPFIYIAFLVALSTLIIYFIVNSSYLLQESIKVSVKNSTEIYFDNIVNTRKWNASYGGVYVKENGKIEPNPYLVDNHIYTKDNEKLIKINPAWMTRQLSELNKNSDYSFKIISQKPINPTNQAVNFEDKALSYLEENRGTNKYYEYDMQKKEFRYLGVLLVDKSCMVCHAHQGYKIGDIRGGISIYKSINTETEQINNIYTRQNFIIVIILCATFMMSYLIYRIFNSNKHLEQEVKRRTKRLEDERKYLQTIKDSNKDIMVITNGYKILDANLAFLKFFDVASIDEFLKDYDCICERFEAVDEDDYISGKFVNNEVWAKYVLEHKDIAHKASIKKDKEEYVFLLTGEYLIDSEKSTILIVLSDITTLEKSKNRLEYLASVDTLTQIMNRSKFNTVMAEEILLAKENSTNLSVIFFDIDHFKKVNDTYGHDIGDTVLVELASLVKNHIRKNDFFARWGGEEFVIIVTANSTIAYNLANKLRAIIEQNKFSKVEHITCSFGVAQLQSQDTCETLIKRSDEALYASKESGRNLVTKI